MYLSQSEVREYLRRLKETTWGFENRKLKKCLKCSVYILVCLELSRWTSWIESAICGKKGEEAPPVPKQRKESSLRIQGPGSSILGYHPLNAHYFTENAGEILITKVLLYYVIQMELR